MRPAISCNQLGMNYSRGRVRTRPARLAQSPQRKHCLGRPIEFAFYSYNSTIVQHNFADAFLQSDLHLRMRTTQARYQTGRKPYNQVLVGLL